MILHALTDYYEDLAKKGEIARPGWAKARISCALELAGDGRLLQAYSLKRETQVGKKLEMRPIAMELPAPIKKSVNIAANFLWDNGAYMLGFDGKGNPLRAARCFEAARELHHRLLGKLDDPFAQAICRFYAQWDVAAGKEHPALAGILPDIAKGDNLVFMFRNTFPADNAALVKAWQAHYDQDDSENAKFRCLVTGEQAEPMPIHPAIKGVQGAQSSGAALVSFNAPAFCSYNREQNFNAPVGKYASFAYTAALNYLLADRKHVKRMGDTSLVYWAESAEPGYQDAFSACMDGSDDNNLTNIELDAFMAAIAQGGTANWDGLPLNPDNRFFILGISPNAARLSVRFFLQGGFGNFIRNIQKHYRDIAIVADNRNKRTHIPLWALLRETVNENANDKSASPQMAGSVLQAVLSGGRYPATLYQQTQLRIRAEGEINRGKAAIIKGYLLRNTDNQANKEGLTVTLNENTTYQPYILGRLFSVAEAIQEGASGVSTIKDKYFSSAAATPAVVFPMVLNLADKHLKKLDGGLKVFYAKQLGGLMAQISESYPAFHSLYEQGIFQIGYYHQTQKRYEKKEKPETAQPDMTKGEEENA